MNAKAEDLISEALELPKDERAVLAFALLRSLDDEEGADLDQAEVKAAWAEELTHRAEALSSGRVITVPWEKVKADLEARIRRGR